MDPSVLILLRLSMHVVDLPALGDFGLVPRLP